MLPAISLKHVSDRIAHAWQNVGDGHRAIGCAQPRPLVRLLYMDLVQQKRMCVQGLQDGRHLGRDDHWPHTRRGTRIKHFLGQVDAVRVEEEYGLVRRRIWRQCLAQSPYDSCAEGRIVPGTALANQLHVGRTRGLHRSHLPSLEGVFIPNQNLGQERLQLRLVADKRNVCKIRASLAPRDILHRHGVSPSHKNVPLPTALEHAYCGLVHV